MRGILFASAFLAVFFTAATSRADIIYDFHKMSATGVLAHVPYAPQLVVTDAAPSTGIDFTRTCAFTLPVSCTTVGSMAGFVSLTDATPNFGTLSLDLIFNADKTLTGSIFEQGLNEDLNSSGSHFDWTGTLLSDRYTECGVGSPCTFTGYWLADTVVPEPDTLVLFASAMAALFLVRRLRQA
jgi:hypothetical protein